jgi:hypothetical protein
VAGKCDTHQNCEDVNADDAKIDGAKNDRWRERIAEQLGQDQNKNEQACFAHAKSGPK